MHSYVNGMPKNSHNIGVAEQLHFEFFVAKNEKLNVQKCQRLIERSWVRICPIPEWLFLLWLWLWLWLLFPNTYFSKSRYVGQWKLHDRFDLTWESLMLCKKTHQGNKMNEWRKTIISLVQLPNKEIQCSYIKTWSLIYLIFCRHSTEKKWYALSKWVFSIYMESRLVGNLPWRLLVNTVLIRTGEFCITLFLLREKLFSSVITQGKFKDLWRREKVKSNPLYERTQKNPPKKVNKSLQSSLLELSVENCKRKQPPVQIVLHFLKNTLFGGKQP